MARYQDPCRRNQQQLALDFTPAQVRSHGLRDAHTHPLVARLKGASFRVPASLAWGYPSLELRAGNSWPLMGFDCDVPEKVLEAMVGNHWGGQEGRSIRSIVFGAPMRSQPCRNLT